MMHVLRQLCNRFRYRRFAADVAEELECHRQMVSQNGGSNVARVMGNELRMRERARDVWIPPTIEALGQDLRDAIRLLWRRPGFTALVTAVLVVGVTVSIVAFALVDALVLRSLPVQRPHELVYLRDPSFSFPQVREVRARVQSLSQSFAWNLSQYEVKWETVGQPSLLMVASGSIHDTLGIAPALGRLLTPADEGSGEHDARTVGVLSHRAWQRRFAGDPAIVGRIVRVEEIDVTIVGVTPPQFFGVSPGRDPELTVPVTLAPRLRGADSTTLASGSWLHLMGRLAPGVSRQRADAEFQVAWRQILESTTPVDLAPERRTRFLSRETGLEAGHAGFSSVRNQFRQPLMVVAGFAVLLLLITCGAAANMLLAQSGGRSREFAVRSALGCGRARLARQLLVEGIVLASLAGGIAVALTPAVSQSLIAMVATSQSPITMDVSIDWRMVAFAVGLAVLTILVCSVAPLLTAARVQPVLALRAGASPAVSSPRWAARALVGVQVACSVVLLVGAALFVRSLAQLLSIDPGYDVRQVIISSIPPAADARHATERLSAVPGVAGVALSLYPPVSDRDGGWTQSVGIDGAAPVLEGRQTFFNAISSGFFRTLGIPHTAGRDFTGADVAGAEPVAIINQAAARRFFPNVNPLGRHITVGFDAARRNVTIVGIVADTRYQRLQEEQREIVYFPLQQSSSATTGRELFATVRVMELNDALMRELGEVVNSATAGRHARIQRLADRIRESLVTERALASVAVGLAASSVFLAWASVFGLMAHVVARRTREIGLRMALGARRAPLVGSIVSEALGLCLIGLAVGLAIAWAGTRQVSALLHGVSPTDPWAYVAVVTLSISAALIAAFVPARRAATVNPAVALRSDEL